MRKRKPIEIKMKGVSVEEFLTTAPEELRKKKNGTSIARARIRRNGLIDPTDSRPAGRVRFPCGTKVVTAEQAMPSNEEIEDAIRAGKGSLVKACQKLKVSRKVLYSLIKKNKMLQLVLAEEQEGRLDEAEDALHDLIGAKHFPAVRFMLVAKGRKRGWREDHKDDDKQKTAPVKINIMPFDGKGQKMTIEVGGPRQRLAKDIVTEKLGTVGGDDDEKLEIETG